ncbi:unnamed protein product [Paramecium sonneborni]|uniref:Uncharacterized protein n=1 Tax=Paramecium sonneborni TaxID=65129 RepID=A0A8S1NI16_9CILI|nr:unnamed protein product [Paramecium sonneborni]
MKIFNQNKKILFSYKFIQAIQQMGCAASKKCIKKASFDDYTHKLDSDDQTNLGMIAFKSLEKKHMVINLEMLSKTCSPEHKCKFGEIVEDI